MIDISLLKRLCGVSGAPGYEHNVRKMIVEEIEDLVDEFHIDNLGNLVCFRKGSTSGKLAIAAHMDEISFIVTHIDDDGFIKFHTLGGFDPKTLTAQRVIIHGKKDIVGVMGTKPIHLMSAEDRKKPVDIKDFFIDTGMQKDELVKFVEVGNTITRERELIEMGDCVNSKSIDNRVSVYILIETLKRLKNKELPLDTYAVFTVQEEVGLRGATTMASGVNPDFSIALDTTIANDLPMSSGSESITKLGQGAAIKILDGSTICDSRMVQFMKNTATTKDIPHQMEILTAGGTDTAALQRYAQGGSIAGAISIPTRYLHQVIEMANKNDILHCTDLLEACILGMNEHNWKF